ncbi:MAG: DUF2007 domain-containing protein [Eubacteriales bacterium]|nr:DUF2007 domain-containing protein [Eubacteriales bacterium]
MFGSKKDKDKNEPVLLITVDSNYQLGLVRSILEENKIPCLAQDRASGGYMRVYAGGSIFGTDIYVAPENEDKARELLNVLDLDNTEGIPDEEELAREALEAPGQDDE